MPFEVIKRVPNVDVKGVTLGEKYTHQFVKDTAFRLPDSERGQAEDIKRMIGQDRKDGKEPSVLVAEVPDRSKKIKFVNNWGSGSAWKQPRPWLEED